MTQQLAIWQETLEMMQAQLEASKNMRKMMAQTKWNSRITVPDHGKGIKRRREVVMSMWIYYIKPENPPDHFVAQES